AASVWPLRFRGSVRDPCICRARDKHGSRTDPIHPRLMLGNMPVPRLRTVLWICPPVAVSPPSRSPDHLYSRSSLSWVSRPADVPSVVFGTLEWRVGLSRPLLRQAWSRLFPCLPGRIAGTLRVNERSVDCFEDVSQDDNGNQADARREDVVVETVKSGVNGSKEGKEQAIGLAIAQIERQFGKGAIMRLGAQPAALEIAVIPTGAISLDVALGVGGIPRGRVTEIYGPEASGKTTLALHLIAEVQQTGGIAAFIDAEHALDPVYAQKLGVKTDELLISQPDTGEQALEIAETLVRSGAIDVIVIDSVAALVPKAEIDGEMGD